MILATYFLGQLDRFLQLEVDACLCFGRSQSHEGTYTVVFNSIVSAHLFEFGESLLQSLVSHLFAYNWPELLISYRWA